MIRFVCECGKQLQAREENAGRLVLCPACQRQVTVPDLPAAAVQQVEPIVVVPPPPPPPRGGRDSPSGATKTNGSRRKSGRDAVRLEAAAARRLASLLLGIFSFCGCSCLTGLPAIIMGILSLRDIGGAGGMLTGKPMALIGIVLGSLGTLCLPPSYYFGVAKFREGVAKIKEIGFENTEQAANKQRSQNNLKQMALAMHNYNDTHHKLPPAGTFLSWRVAILPFIEQQGLYNQFKLDEPWDGPDNKKLLAKMPKIYQLPGDDKTPSDHTHYQVFVGNGAVFNPWFGGPIMAVCPDGTSNTILIAEVEKAVPWTKPEDVPFDPTRSMLPLMSKYFRSGFQVALADGSVRTVTSSMSEATFKNAINGNDGNALGADLVTSTTSPQTNNGERGSPLLSPAPLFASIKDSSYLHSSPARRRGF